MVAAVREGQKMASRDYRSKGTDAEITIRKEQGCCFYCGKKGHIKKNCRQRIKDEEIVKSE